MLDPSSSILGYRWVLKRTAPILEPQFRVPTRNDVDSRLLVGSLIFGTGWGIAGFCPGGALPALGTGKAAVVLFVLALLTGIVLTRQIDSYIHSKASKRTTNLTH